MECRMVSGWSSTVNMKWRRRPADAEAAGHSARGGAVVPVIVFGQYTAVAPTSSPGGCPAVGPPSVRRPECLLSLILAIGLSTERMRNPCGITPGRVRGGWVPGWSRCPDVPRRCAAPRRLHPLMIALGHATLSRTRLATRRARTAPRPHVHCGLHAPGPGWSGPGDGTYPRGQPADSDTTAVMSWPPRWPGRASACRCALLRRRS